MVSWWRRILGGGAEPAPGAPVAPEIRAPAVGDVLGGRYLLDHLIARGGAGYVFRGHDRHLDMQVAIKVIDHDPDSGVDGELKAEAMAAMRLSHPFIARTYHWEVFGHREALIMEYVPGPNLHMVARDLPDMRLPLEVACGLTIDVLEALGHAHTMGIIHNDIKPRNLLVAPGEQVKVCDFGIARRREVASFRGAHWIVGTVAYMAPERIRHEDATIRSDVYAVGATLYNLLHGRPPFGVTPDEAFDGHLKREVPPSPAIPADVMRVITRSMAKAQSDRYRTTAEMAAALTGLGFQSRYHAWQAREATALEEEQRVWVVPPRPEEALTPAGPEPREVVPPPPPEPTPTPSFRLALPKLVRVPGRELMWGHLRVRVRGHRLAPQPVTREAWASYVAGAGLRAPKGWTDGRPPAGTERWPMTNITLDEARRYAAASGARLPTASEWIAAATASRDAVFPWGDACARGRCACPQRGKGGPASVDAHVQSRSPDGILGLYGNVWEFVEPDEQVCGDGPGTSVALGGSWRSPCPARRGTVPRSDILVDLTYDNVGFRLALDGEAG